ncbi:MAG TPA: FtsX-like permease family protein [Verrucomicrobiales bacterium]|nr:FtsX-like permease family protein [Verrucomicrobiales bacterium]HIL71931.1 FtsX-like permease family protein [Verrucomicrobiota bacterium]
MPWAPIEPSYVMKLLRLIFLESIHRKTNCGLTLIAVTLAVACFAATMMSMDSDLRQTRLILQSRQEAVAQAGADLEDSMRKITKGLGFNVLILPEDQDLNELHLEGGFSKSMPESYVETLAGSKIVTVNHLLPTVTRKIKWPEQKREIILYGTRGEVPLMHRDPKKPLLDAVPKGKMIGGFQIAHDLEFRLDDEVVLLGKEFSILKIHDQRGTIDDSTIWIHLGEAQKLLGMENLIHAIQALECYCVGDRITQIRKEIASILPGTQVIERGPPALARAEARQAASDTAVAALELEKGNRLKLHQQREKTASIVIPLVLVSCAVWIGFLSLGNVRERKSEIGVMRALGFDAPRILFLFTGKAIAIGIMGAFVGWFSAYLFTGTMSGVGEASSPSLSVSILSWSLLIAVLISFVGSWLPALIAARQDPADVLRD